MCGLRPRLWRATVGAEASQRPWLNQHAPPGFVGSRLLLPNPERDAIRLDKRAALGALAGLMPFANAVVARHRTGRFEAQPAKTVGAARREAIQRRLEGRRPRWSFDGIEPAGFEPPTVQGGVGRHRHFQPGYRVVEFLALDTHNGLDREVNSPVHAAGDLRAISAFRTFKQIAAAHGGIFLFVAPFRKPWEALGRRRSLLPELSALAPKRKSGCLCLRARLCGHGCTAEDSYSDPAVANKILS